MATVILVRHGRTSANTSGVLAGRAAGVKLDDAGRAQVDKVAQRLAGVPLAAVVTSPLERCRQTARAILDAQPGSPHTSSERGITECDYGTWQGQALKNLAKDRLWRTVQTQPSAAAFPEGESLAAMQARAVAAVRRLDADVEGQHGPGAVWVAVSHGDVIKAVLADALGMHLDLFQRLHVDPGSCSIVRYATDRPYVLASNTHEGDLAWLVPQKGRRGRARKTPTSPDAVVGGGAGPDSPEPTPSPGS